MMVGYASGSQTYLSRNRQGIFRFLMNRPLLCTFAFTREKNTKEMLFGVLLWLTLIRNACFFSSSQIILTNVRVKSCSKSHEKKSTFSSELSRLLVRFSKNCSSLFFEKIAPEASVFLWYFNFLRFSGALPQTGLHKFFWPSGVDRLGFFGQPR